MHRLLLLGMALFGSGSALVGYSAGSVTSNAACSNQLLGYQAERVAREGKTDAEFHRLDIKGHKGP